jgi:hypothetical protein
MVLQLIFRLRDEQFGPAAKQSLNSLQAHREKMIKNLSSESWTKKIENQKFLMAQQSQSRSILENPAEGFMAAMMLVKHLCGDVADINEIIDLYCKVSLTILILCITAANTGQGYGQCTFSHPG